MEALHRFHVVLQSDDSSVVKASIKALDKIFCHLTTNGSLVEEGPVLEKDADKKVREWSRERYQEFQDHLFKLIEAEQISLQEQALVSLMHLLQAEGQHPLQKLPEGKEHLFPLDLLEVPFAFKNENIRKHIIIILWKF